MSKLTITLIMGLQGSGKTTLAKALCNERDDLVRVNKDDIRSMLHDGAYTPDKEQLVKAVWELSIAAALNAKKHVVIDDAGNLNPETQKWIVRRFGSMFDIIYNTECLKVPIEECIRRDLKRQNSVGEAVIRQYAHRYLPKPTSRVLDPDKKEAIVVDVDGCIAIITDRDPLDCMAAGSDKVYEPLDLFLDMMPEEKTVIFLTGRKESSRGVLSDWLNRNLITNDSTLITMRPDNDRRPADVFKGEAIEKIMEDFNVVLAIDDDPRVIQMYKNKQIPTWQISHS